MRKIISASQYIYFSLAYRGLSEEEGTSQKLQQLFQFHNIFIFYAHTGDCQKRREQVRSSSSSFSFTISLLFTWLQGTVRRGGKKSGAPAAVSAFQCLYFLLAIQGTVRRGGNKSEAPAAVQLHNIFIFYFLLAYWGLSEEEGTGTQAEVSASQYLYFLLAYRGLSEEEGTSQELQQQFQLHNVFINHKLSTLKVGGQFQAF